MVLPRWWFTALGLLAALLTGNAEGQDCTACPACVGCAGCIDFFEPNDTTGTAGWSVLDAPYVSYLCEQDIDFWKLPGLVAGQKILVTLDDLPLDYDLSILAPSGEVRGFSDDPRRNDGLLLEIGSQRYPPGDYQVRVKPGRSGKTEPRRPYTVGAREISCQLDEFDAKGHEANQRPEHAVSIADEVASFARVGLTLCPGGDQDWFSRYLEAGDELTVLVDYPRSPAPATLPGSPPLPATYLLEVCLFGQDPDKPLACIDDDHEPRQLTYTVPAGAARQKYLVRVLARAYLAPPNPTYALVVSAPKRVPEPPPPMPPRFPNCAESPLLEPNDRISDVRAQPIFEFRDGETREGFLCDPTDADLWTVPGIRGQMFQVSVTHPDLKFNLALLSADGRPEVQVVSEPKGDRTLLTYRFEKEGTWFLEVTPFGGAFDPRRPYSLMPRLYSCPDSYEPNGDAGSAARIFDDGLQVFSRICHSGDVDFYKFTGDAGQRVFLDLNGRSYQDFELVLLDEGLGFLGSTQDSLERELPEDSEYFVRVASRSGRQYNEINPYSFSLLLGGSPAEKPRADLRLLGLEVTQGIQDLAHSVPLFAGKDTLVRAYVDVLEGPAVVRGVELYLSTLSGDSLATPGQIRCGNAFGARKNPDKKRLRNRLDLGPFCRLPTRWLTMPGELRLKAHLHATGLHELDESDNHTNLSLVLESPRTFELQLIPVRDHCRGGCTAEDGPLPEVLDDLVRQAEILYPLAKIHRVPYKGWLPFSGSSGNLVRDIHRLPRNAPVSANTIRLGVIRNTADGKPVNGHCNADSKIGFIRLTGSANETLIHEVAHCLGMSHIDDGGATQGGDFGFEPYPHKTNTLGTDTWDSFYGTDLRLPTPRVLPPAETSDIMTYQYQRWISDYTYRKLHCLMDNLSLAPQQRWKRCPP